MIKELLYKWFDLQDLPCKTCETLRSELDFARRQNEYLLGRLLNPREETQPANEAATEFKPIAPSGGRRFIPHAVKQQLSEREDMKSLEIMQKKKRELAELEKEVLGQENEDASKIG